MSDRSILETRIKHYEKVINKIDDYFEYRFESEKDRAFVIDTIDQMTAMLQSDIENE